MQIESLQQQVDEAQAEVQSVQAAQQQTAKQLQEALTDKDLLQDQLDIISLRSPKASAAGTKASLFHVPSSM